MPPEPLRARPRRTLALAVSGMTRAPTGGLGRAQDVTP